MTRTTGLATDPRDTVVAIGCLDRVLCGHGVVAADPHLEFPVVALGQGDEIGIGILTLGDLSFHLLARLGGELHCLFGLKQRILEHVVEPGVGPLQNERRQRRDSSTRRGGHGVQHVVYTGTNVVQRISNRRDRIELATTVTETELCRTAQGHRDYRGIGRCRDRLRTTDLVVPETVFRRCLGGRVGAVPKHKANQQ